MFGGKWDCPFTWKKIIYFLKIEKIFKFGCFWKQYLSFRNYAYIYICSSAISPNRFFASLRIKAWSNISDIQTDSSLRCAWRRGVTSPTYKQILRCAQNDNASFAGVGTDGGFAAISASVVRCDVVILSEAKNLYEFKGATSRIARSYVMKKDILTAINLCSCPEEKFIQL